VSATSHGEAPADAGAIEYAFGRLTAARRRQAMGDANTAIIDCNAIGEGFS
jgi:hypothetical protein